VCAANVELRTESLEAKSKAEEATTRAVKAEKALKNGLVDAHRERDQAQEECRGKVAAAESMEAAIGALRTEAQAARAAEAAAIDAVWTEHKQMEEEFERTKEAKSDAKESLLQEQAKVEQLTTKADELLDAERLANERLRQSEKEAERAKQVLEAEIGDRFVEARSLSTKLVNVESKLAKVTQELEKTKDSLIAKTELAENTAREKKVLEIVNHTLQEQQGNTSSKQTQAITDLHLKIDNLSNQVETKRQEVVVKETLVIQNQDVNEQLRLQLQEAQQTIRDMHNAIQDLKGNIRVFCRVRPTADADAVPAIKLCDEIGQVSVCWNEEEHGFTFDKAFGVASTQQQVFDEVEGVVQSALDGYKVCIFAYGQTGSGKTYTMQGNPSEPEGWGIIPRTLHKILESAEAMRAKGWTWTLTASFMEVYNESFRDLLAGPDSPSGTHTIVHDEAYGSSVTNMTTADIQSLDQVNRLMARAAKKRSVGNTDMNSESSRSHAIFALYLLGVNKEHKAKMNGALHLVDLAGSERLDKSGATGTRLRETQNINKSLSSLVDVFEAKAEGGRTHIPFRNSKLTHFMEPCLSGNGKTIMVLNAGPEQDHSHESLCSLRFAKQVAQCTTGGKPQRFVKSLAPAASSSSSTSNTQPRPQTPTSRHPTPTQGRPTWA